MKPQASVHSSIRNMSKTVASGQSSEKSHLPDFGNISVKLSRQDAYDVEETEKPLPETKPMPLPQEIAPRPTTQEEGHDDGDIADYLSEEFQQQFKIDWEDETDPRLAELVQYGEIRSWIPGYAFNLNLKFCDECVKYMLTHLTVVKQQSGMYLLRYFMCPGCIAENAIKLKG